jgi:hypothetical protein
MVVVTSRSQLIGLVNAEGAEAIPMEPRSTRQAQD